MHVAILLSCLLTFPVGSTGREVLVIENFDQEAAGVEEMEDFSSVLQDQITPTDKMDVEAVPVLKPEPDATPGDGQEKLKIPKTNLPGLKVYDQKRIVDFNAFELFHLSQRVVMNLRKPTLDSIVPIEKVTLKGQGLNLNLRKEDAVEQILGEDISPDSIKNVNGCVITQNINGLPERLFVFSYSSGSKTYSLEPNKAYRKNSDFETFNKYKSKVIQDVIINGINHTIYEVEEKPNRPNIKTEHIHIPLVMVVDDSVVNRFLNATTTGNEAFEEAKKYLMAVQEAVMDEMSRLSTPELRLTTNIDEVIRFRATTNSSEDKENLDVDILNDENSFGMYRDKIVVLVTKKRIVDKGTQLPGIGRGDICDQPRILLQAIEFFQASRDLVQLLRKLLGLCNEKETYVSNSAGCQKETVEENLKMKKHCLASNDQKAGSVMATNLSLKSQCQFVYGPGYIPCIPQETDGICSKLACKHQSGCSGCASLKGMKALPGSPCAPGRLCRSGECKLDVGASLEFNWHVESGLCRNEQGSLERLMVISLAMGGVVLTLVIGSVVWTLCFACRRKPM